MSPPNTLIVCGIEEKPEFTVFLISSHTYTTTTSQITSNTGLSPQSLYLNPGI